ncbi:hypothetical protein Q3G72_013921 [Acer saccharum]|nr:hypothetical protein Q3G72_013921 [Acer saccharum]
MVYVWGAGVLLRSRQRHLFYSWTSTVERPRKKPPSEEEDLEPLRHLVFPVLALPLSHRPLFPGFYMPLYLKDPKLVAALQENRNVKTLIVGPSFLKISQAVILQLLKQKKVSVMLKEKNFYNCLHEVGTIDQITIIQGDQVILIGHRRLRITEMVSEDPLKVNVDHLKDNPYDKDDDVIKATSFEVISTLRDVLKTSLLSCSNIYSDFGAAISGGNKVQCQAVLEELDVCGIS